jgi:hypothetical protein
MRTSHKFGLIAGGYVGAFLVASAAVAVHVAATSGPDRDGSSGMYAFGDSILFLAVFALAAVPSTGLALFSLRAYAGLWRALSGIALAIAATGLSAGIAFRAGRMAEPGSFIRTWSGLSPLRILAAPMLALMFGVAGVVAPSRGPRVALLVAAAIEAIVFALAILIVILGR